MRSLALLAGLVALAPSLMAQVTPSQVGDIGFPSVASALEALSARDGNGTIVTHADGWTYVNEPLASAQWSVTPRGHDAYPAVVRRTIKHAPDGSVAVETASLCEAPQEPCDKLLAEFAAMNERITQAVKARGRRPVPPPAP